VHSAIAAAVQLVKHTAESAGAQIDVRLEPGACHARGQSNRFEQIIVNLLRNAIDAVAGKPAGQITLTQTVEGSDIVITVADNGHGLGKLDMNDLREPFFSTKPSGMGMGLGLAISAQIVNEMGGEIGARNGPDQGAIFVVKLLKIEPADA
jgi:two-component system C4-dicarboxylate transport sensor histidine kinase DctB